MSGGADTDEASALPSIRLDKWLWQARFFKTSSLCAKLISAGKVRVNGAAVSKPARAVSPNDVLTFSQEKDVRVIKILDCGVRRGPAPEAQLLYEDMAPIVRTPRDLSTEGKTPFSDRKGRPTKKDRRDIIAEKRSHLE